MGKRKIKGTAKLIKCDDCVLLTPHSPEEEPRVARVNKRFKRMVLVSWYYRPEDTIYGRLGFQGKNELLSSDHSTWVSIDSIEGKCKVHSEQAYANLKEVNADDFLCRSKYDAVNKVLTEDTTFHVYCTCELPYNPDHPMIQCETCKCWFHPPCVGINTMAQLENTPTFICKQCSYSKDAETTRHDDAV